MKLNQVKRNHFEMATHNVQFQHPFVKHQRLAFKNEWPDAIKPNTTMIDYILFAAIFLFGVGMLLTII